MQADELVHRGLGSSTAPAAGEQRPELGSRLVAEARRGDHIAFTVILRHYDPQLRALVGRLLQDRDAMDDVMQEAALRAFRALPRFRGEASLGTWMHRIAYTTCIDHLRRRERWELVPDAELPDPASCDDDPAVILDRRERVAARLAVLPIDQKAAVVLVDQQELDYRTAAAIIGVPVGTLASRLAAARHALRETYAHDLDPLEER